MTARNSSASRSGSRVKVLQAEVAALTEQIRVLQRGADLASSMLRATSSINASLSLSEVIRQVLESTVRLLRVEKSSVMLHDPGTDELRVIGSRGLSKDAVQQIRFRSGEGVAGHVVRTGKPLIIEDVSKDGRFAVRPGHDRTRESIACVPLKADHQVLGVLSVDRLSGAPFLSQDEVAYLTFLAEHATVAIRNARLHEDLLQRATQLSTLYEVGSALTSVLNVDRLLNKIVEGVTEVTGAQICSLMLLDEDGKFLRIRVAKGLSPEVIKRTIIPVGEGISGHVAETGEALLITDIETHPLFRKKSQKKYNSRSLLAVPLKIKGRVIGVLNVNNKQPHGVFTDDDQNLLTLFASQAAVTIENANLYQHLERLATTDGLTGLFVHRHFQERLAEELRRAKRYKRPLSVVMMDIDFFKNLNDAYGHQTGDSVLREVAHIMRTRGAREEDILGRYGGEEFVVASVESDKRAGLIIAERLRSSVEQHEFKGKSGPLRLTISAGVACFPADGDTREQLIQAADQALYHAKRSGRNRVAYFGRGGRVRVNVLKRSAGGRRRAEPVSRPGRRLA